MSDVLTELILKRESINAQIQTEIARKAYDSFGVTPGQRVRFRRNGRSMVDVESDGIVSQESDQTSQTGLYVRVIKADGSLSDRRYFVLPSDLLERYDVG